MYARLLFIGLVAGCIHDHYTCATDADCDLGVAGRYEIDHHCTSYDPFCTSSGRRYNEHSDSLSNTCFDDRVAPLNLCAPGQPPATQTVCTTDVCSLVLACCTTGWSETCVQLAQTRCDIKCDTRIAIVASRPPALENWTLDWNGTKWTGQQNAITSSLVWLAPAPGSATPRLARLDMLGRTLVIDAATSITFPLDHHIQEVASVDFDRDGRDTIAVGYLDDQTPPVNHIEIIKLDDLSNRDLGDCDATVRLSWGDYDHDAFPDAVGGYNGRYSFLDNAEPPNDHIRILNSPVRKTLTPNMIGNGTPGVRSIDWADLNNDGVLDSIVFGNAVRVHYGQNILDPNQATSIDCDPPTTMVPSCADESYASLAGATVPDQTKSQILFSVDYEKTMPTTVLPTRNLFRVTADTFTAPQALAFSTVCGTPCQPIHAVVVRDLDGDHKLDIVAIDAELHLFVALSKTGDLSHLVDLPIQPINTSNDVNKPFTAVRVSVTGSPR